MSRIDITITPCKNGYTTNISTRLGNNVRRLSNIQSPYDGTFVSETIGDVVSVLSKAVPDSSVWLNKQDSIDAEVVAAEQLKSHAAAIDQLRREASEAAARINNEEEAVDAMGLGAGRPGGYR